MNKTFGVIGGDRRQAELARLLAEDGGRVCTYGLEDCPTGEGVSLEGVASAEVVLLPLPLCGGDGTLNCGPDPMPTVELFQRLGPGQRVLAGQIKPQQRQEAAACGLKLEDYFLREELQVANAAATAEGAVQVAMEHLDRTLLGMDCLVLGFGRIGKLLSCRLRGLGARVTVAARSSADRAWVRACGWQALETGGLDGRLDAFDAVFNTVPALLLDGALLAQLPRGCLCVELASQPGIDLEAAECLGLTAVWARSLPGRLTPRTAAAAIRDAVYDILLEA
jgi:dipicolinate synthase subunit A